MIRTSLVLPEALHQRLVTYAKEEKKSITKLVQELLVKALTTKEQVRIQRMYQDLSELENLGPRGVKDASTTINQTLYENGERRRARMKNEFDYLLDSDVLVGRFFPDDPHNQNARNMFEVLEDKRKSLVTTSLVVVETATVLSHKASQALAIKFLQVVNRGNMPIIHINEGLQQAALKTFARQTKKGTSVVDCSNVTVMQKFNIPAIVSFDKVYRKRFGLKVYC